MKTLFYIIGGAICLGLIITAMYVAMTIGLSCYIAYTNNLKGRQYAAQQRAAEQAQMQSSISSLNNDMTPDVVAKRKAAAEMAGTAPSLLTDPEGYGTEDNWLASTISREMAEMAFFAAQPGAALPGLKVKATVDPKTPSVHVVIDASSGGTLTSDLTPVFAWDANGYAPLAKQLIGTTAAPATESADQDVLAHLLVLTGPKLAEEDVRLAANLQAHPSSWQDHEAAALLLTAMALRNEGSTYADNRLLLCKATAHLALAQAWRGDAHPTWPGLIADAAIRTLSGRELDAVGHLQNLGAQAGLPEAAKPWISALLVRATEDWRKAEVMEKSPLLLKIVWFRILEMDLENDEPVNRLFTALPKPPVDLTIPPTEQKVNPDTLLPDWGRIAGQSPYYDDADDAVKNAEYKLDLEFHELDEILKVEKAAPFDLNQLATVFAEKPTDTIAPGPDGKTVVHVIGPGGFKTASLGHIFDGLITKDPRQSGNGDPGEMQNVFAKMEKLFQGVPGYEIARLHLGFLDYDASKKQYADWVAAKKTWPVWEFPYALADDMPGEAHLNAFYANAVPFGTVYEPELGQRYTFINAVNRQTFPPFDTPELERIKKLPPNEANAQMVGYSQKYNELIRQMGPQGPQPFEQQLLALAPDVYTLAQDHLPNEKLLANLSRFLDYNMNPIERIENLPPAMLSDADREMVLRKHVVLEPAFGFRAAVVLRSKGLVDEAAAMDRKAFASGDNPIGISNSVLPLVDYDLAHGLNDEAVKVAQFAGAVKSEMGLSILTFAMEKLGRLDEAEAAAKEDAEMYSDPSWLTNFQLRHPDRYPEVYKRELASRFPDGLQHAKIGDFTGSPNTGAVITSDSDTLKGAGLMVGDVIVALDGYRVDSEPQYMFIRALSMESKMNFVIWRKDRYLEATAAVPGRRMMVDIVDFHNGGL
jgi:hypothetical protein